MPAPVIRTVFVTCDASLDGRTLLYKVHVGRLGEFPRPPRFAAFPHFTSGWAVFEAEKLPKGAGWRFIRELPLAEIHPSILEQHHFVIQRVERAAAGEGRTIHRPVR